MIVFGKRDTIARFFLIFIDGVISNRVPVKFSIYCLVPSVLSLISFINLVKVITLLLNPFKWSIITLQVSLEKTL